MRQTGLQWTTQKESGIVEQAGALDASKIVEVNKILRLMKIRRKLLGKKKRQKDRKKYLYGTTFTPSSGLERKRYLQYFNTAKKKLNT